MMENPVLDHLEDLLEEIQDRAPNENENVVNDVLENVRMIRNTNSEGDGNVQDQNYKSILTEITEGLLDYFKKH